MRGCAHYVTVSNDLYLQNYACLIGSHSTFVPQAHSMCLPLSVFVHYLQHFAVALMTYTNKFEFLVIPRSLLLDTMGDASSSKLFDWIRASIESSVSALPLFMDKGDSTTGRRGWTYESCVQMLNNIRGAHFIESTIDNVVCSCKTVFLCVDCSYNLSQM
jgi:hypothetical protein